MKKCQFCQKEFVIKSKKGVFCSPKCRVYYNRNNKENVENQDVEKKCYDSLVEKTQPDLISVLRNNSVEVYMEEYESVYLKKKAPRYVDQGKWDADREKRLNELKIIIKSLENGTTPT